MPERYRTVVADPPWHLSTGPTGKGGIGGIFSRVMTTGSQPVPYRSMSVEEIAQLPVGDLAEPDAHLYLWTVNAYLRASYGIVEAWGFRPAQLLTWCKPPMGLGPGGAFSTTTEFVIFARRGKLATQARRDSTWWCWPRRVGPPVRRGEDRRTMHSAKPEAFIDLVEQVSPGPYVELFARRDRLGWDTWGNESLGTAEMAS